MSNILHTLCEDYAVINYSSEILSEKIKNLNNNCEICQLLNLISDSHFNVNSLYYEQNDNKLLICFELKMNNENYRSFPICVNLNNGKTSNRYVSNYNTDPYGFENVTDENEINFNNNDQKIIEMLNLNFVVLSVNKNNNLFIELIEKNSPYSNTYRNPKKLIRDYKNCLLDEKELKKYKYFFYEV